jgi:uncharacterized protein YjbI with pentapeptide repeats
MAIWSDRYSGVDFTGGHDGDEFTGIFVDVNFSGTSLIGARLPGQFMGVVFANTPLSRANLAGGSFINATFLGADVTEAQIRAASYLENVVGPQGQQLP